MPNEIFSLQTFAAPLLSGLAALTLTPRAPAGELYGITQVLDEVYLIDTTTGAATLVAAIPPGDNIRGIAFDASGALFGIDGWFFENRLWALDPGAGSATLIGGTGSDAVTTALAIDPSTGLLYSRWSLVTGSHELITIDPTTGLATPVAPLTGVPFPSGFAGMTFLPDGTLLGYDPQNYTLPSLLYSVDTSTGAATVIGDIGDVPATSIFGGLAYDSDTDTLYMSNAAELWTIDPTTGVGTLVGNHGIVDLMNGLAVLPDPVPTCLLGLDLASTLWDVDPLTGGGSNPRPLGDSKFGGLAMDTSGQLFGTRTAPVPELFSIDPTTGIATLIGPLGIPHNEGGLDFHPTSGELYGVGGLSELFLIDTTTGAATLLGPLLDEFASPIDPSAMAFDDAGALFVLKAASVPPELYQVDPSDGTVFDRVPLPGLPLAFFGGMDFDDTTGLLHLTYGDVLYRANPYTGATVTVGPTPLNFSALEVSGPCDPPPPFVIPGPPRRRRPPGSVSF